MRFIPEIGITILGAVWDKNGIRWSSKI